MKKPFAASVGMVFLCTSVGIHPLSAQMTFTTPNNEAARAPRPPRDRGPALTPALIPAQTAVEDCKEWGYQVTAVVVDSAGLPVMVLSGDGAAAITQSIAMGKPVSSVRNGKPSAALAIEAQKDSELAARLEADRQQGPQRGGGIPIMSDSTAIAVSGSPDAGWDVECALAG